MSALDKYLKEVEAALRLGNATEHTHRPAAKVLLESISDDITATNEPQRIQCGSPDFIVTRRSVPIGYVEAKDVGSDLDAVQESEQLIRYRKSLRNLILTDYLEFRLFRYGELVHQTRLANLRTPISLKRDSDGIAATNRLLRGFLNADVPSISSPRELAERMATLARLIHDLIRLVFAREGIRGDLHGQYEAFKKVLLADLSGDQFADMYAQTIAYGLFAARCNYVGSGFSREKAGRELPRTNPFLRKLFNNIAGADLDDRISWAVDDLAELLARADMATILADFGKATRQEDPVVHFYETFLAAYDPDLRETRGVYFTPEPVVGYIVRSIDALLKREFSLKDGLADSSNIKLTLSTPYSKKKTKEVVTHRVQILDPACGTGTFLYSAIKNIQERFNTSKGLWAGYVAKNLLPRLYGFELLMAPYAVAHMKLGLELRESGYDFASDERLRVFLTNSLEEGHELADLPLFAQWLAEEAASAADTKQNAPIMVVLGNPPYSGHSANKGKWIHDLLRGHDRLTRTKTGNYFEVDGKPLGEKQPKWLNDDYVKFIRFAQWRIDQTGYGVLGFITNHGYLDNPTFRGMRQSLMDSFDKIFVLDLHGSAKKKETAPDRSVDQNVFDIQQGVAIGLFVKTKKTKGESLVFHGDVWGNRSSKYSWLQGHDVVSTTWKTLKPTSPSYLFVPEDSKVQEEYAKGFSVREIFPENNNGVLTSRDDFVVGFTFGEIAARMEVFLDERLSDQDAKEELKLSENYQWRVSEARKELRKSEPIDTFDKPYLYRPFDVRRILFHPSVVWRTREETMGHMSHSDSLALATTRQVEIGRGWEHAFCSRVIMDHHAVSLKEINYLFPLFVYSNKEGDLVDQAYSKRSGGKRANLSAKFVESLASALKLRYVPDGSVDLKRSFGPHEVFHYIYAILFSPGYRTRYSEQLRRDFPRVPITSDKGLFVALCAFGQRLVELHTLSNLPSPITKYPEPGSNLVNKLAYDRSCVYINEKQYFTPISTAIWEFHIGGYQVAQKWLKDRKGRTLTYDELLTYQGVIAAIAETIDIQGRIDKAIAHWPLPTKAGKDR